MPVEVQLVGSPQRWLLERETIRIGRSPECEVELPAADFPEVSREHAMLLVVGQTLRLFDRRSGNGTYVNAERIEEAALTAGDTVRLGAEGPELLFRLVTTTSVAAGQATETAGRPEAGEWSSFAASTLRAPVTPMAASTLPAGGAPGGESAGAPTMALPRAAAPKPSGAPPGRKGRPGAPLPAAKPTPPPVFEAPPAVAARSEVSPNEASRNEASRRSAAAERAVLEQALGGLRALLLASLIVLLLLGAVLLYAVQQLGATRDDLARMRAEATAALARVQPTMDRDQQQLQSLNGQLAAQEKAAEDHFVARMDKELPALMDRYMDAKAKSMGLNVPVH